MVDGLDEEPTRAFLQATANRYRQGGPLRVDEELAEYLTDVDAPARGHRGRRRAALLVAATALVGLAATVGALPASAQRLIAGVADAVGVAVPAPSTSPQDPEPAPPAAAHGHGADRSRKSPPDTARAPSAPVVPSPGTAVVPEPDSGGSTPVTPGPSAGIAPGLEVAPGQSGPPGLAPDPGRATAPGQSSPPGPAIAPAGPPSATTASRSGLSNRPPQGQASP